MATSPVFIDGKVVLLVDTPDEAFLAAYDARSGKQVWNVERPTGFMGSYATPAIHKDAKGRSQLVVAGAVELTGYDPANGKRLWWAGGVTTAPAAPPLVTGDSVYTVEPVGEGAPDFSGMLKQFDKNGNKQIELTECSGSDLNSTIMGRVFRSIDKHIGNKDGAVSEDEYNRSFGTDETAGGLVRLRLNADGDIKRNVVWRHTKGLPYVTGPLLYQNILYSIRNGGILSTFDPETGKLLREARVKEALGEYYASPVAGDGKLYLVNLEGKVSVLRAGADWEVISSGDLGEQVIATPAIADGRIYVRTDKTLWAFAKGVHGDAK
jgi:outer membrane protein assembly factor BamB